MRAKILLGFAALSLLAGGLKAQGADDSEARPPVTKGDLEIVKRAREILSSPAKWNRADTRVCPADEKTFSLYCALEKATDEVSAHFEHRGAAMQEARFVIEEVAPHKDYEHRLMGYNNDPTTTFADIQKVFSLLEAHVAKRLQEGPAASRAVPVSASVSAANSRVRATDLAILKHARALLDSEAKWDRADTQKCPADAPTVGLYCAFVRAAMEVTGKPDDDGAAIKMARSIISQSAPNREKYKARLIDYNHDPTVSFRDVQKLFQLVEERLAGQMAEQARGK